MDIEPKDNYFSIHANELKDKYQDKCVKRTHVYNKILEKCYYRIKKASDNDESCVLFPIPEFILGVPTYNLAYCSAYIIYNLKRNNYVAKFYNPNLIFILWKYDAPEYFEPKKTITYIEPRQIKNSMNTIDNLISTTQNTYGSYKPINSNSNNRRNFINF